MKSRKFARCLVVLSWRNFSPLFRPSAGSHHSANTKIFSYWFLRPARAIATGRCETWSKIIPLFCLRRGNKLLQYFRARFRVRAPASVCTPEYISQSFGPRWVKSEISYSRGWMSRVKYDFCVSTFRAAFAPRIKTKEFIVNYQLSCIRGTSYRAPSEIVCCTCTISLRSICNSIRRLDFISRWKNIFLFINPLLFYIVITESKWFLKLKLNVPQRTYLVFHGFLKYKILICFKFKCGIFNHLGTCEINS